MDAAHLSLEGDEGPHKDNRLVVVKTPKPPDVLCGRGKMAFDHIGNDCFRVLISRAVDAYQAAPTKKSKTHVIHQIVDTIYARGGRFLVHKNGQWIDGGVEQGKKKTGYALRDAARGRVKCIFEPAPVIKLGNQQNSTQTNNIGDRWSRKTNSHTCSNIDFPSAVPSTVDIIIPNRPFSSISQQPIFAKDDNVRPRKVKAEAEPERDWRNSELDTGLADDLIDFFVDEKVELVSDPEPKNADSLDEEFWHIKPLYRSSTI